MNRNVAVLAAAFATALGLAGCDEKCPTETPKIEDVQSCTTGPGVPVNVKVQVCEKCNQTATTCQVDINGTTIQLDPVAEACKDDSSCAPGCNVDPNVTCTFTAPATPATYTLLVYNPATPNDPVERELIVQAGLTSTSCAFPYGAGEIRGWRPHPPCILATLAALDPAGHGGTMPAHRDAWLSTAGRDLPLDVEALFPEGDGFGERRRAQRRARWVSRLRPVLGKLEPGEVVRHVALGVRYRFAEFYFSAYLVAHHANLTALVLTDRRLLLVSCRSNGAPRDVKCQVRLDRLREAKPRKVFGGLYLVLDDGTKPFFTSVPGADARRLAELTRSARPAAPAAPAAGGAPALEALCPACLAVVPGAVGSASACPSPACRIPFRSPRRAARLSALVPGVGDIYLRHHAFGAFEFVGSIVLLCLALFLAAEAVDLEGAGFLAVLLGLLVVFPRVVDYFLTLHMGRKGYVPLADRPAPGGDARNLPAFAGWALALFAAGALAVAGTGVAAVSRASERAVLRGALAEARAGRFDEAMEAFRQAEARGLVGDEDRARVGLALLEAGDVQDGEQVIAPLADVQIDDGLARRIDAIYERNRTAVERLEQGYSALVEVDHETAFRHFDAALPVLRGIRRPAFPASRGEVVLEFVANVVPQADADGPLDLCAGLVDLAEREGAPADRVASARAALEARRKALARPAEAVERPR